MKVLFITLAIVSLPASALPPQTINLIFELEPYGKTTLSMLDGDGCIANAALQKITSLSSIVAKNRSCTTFTELSNAGFSVDQLNQLNLVVIRKIPEEQQHSEIDEGIDAAFINYEIDRSQEHSDDNNRTSENYQLDSGVNLGGWRLRHGAHYSKQDGEQGWLNDFFL